MASTTVVSAEASRAAYKKLTNGQTLGSEHGSLAGYKVDATFGNLNNGGLQGYAFRNPTSGDVIIAFRGTNDLQDAVDDVGNLGYSQWQQGKKAVETYLKSNSSANISF